MAKPIERKCGLPDCTVSKDGQCLKGLEVSSCPHIVVQGDEVRSGAQVTRVGGDVLPSDTIALPDGLELTVDSASKITSAALTRVVVVAGEADSGKTTLLATIFHKLNEGPFAGYIFAGSKTLFAWERRCHLSRIACGRARPDTERTLNKDCALLHLRLRVADLDRPPQDVLFTDISGEAFRNIRDSTEECRRLGILRRADHFVLAVDGKKLTEPSQRHEAFQNAALVLRSCMDAEMLSTQSFVDVLVTKLDIITTAENSQETQEFVDHVRSTVTTKFKDRVARLRFFEVAARPEKGELEVGYGLGAILPAWVEDSPLYCARLPYKVPRVVMSREFENYLFRRLPGYLSGT